MDAEKKKRSSNWDSSEISLLRQLVEKNLVTIRSKLSNALTNKVKNEVWRNITTEINSLGLHCRSVAEVKVKWQNMQSNAKKTYADVKKHARQTGGGPPATPVDQESQHIIEMMKDTASFVGLTGEESPVDEVDLTKKAKCMHEEIKNFLANYNSSCSKQLPRANDVHLIPFLVTSTDDDLSSEYQIDELANFLCANYPRLQDISSQDVSSLLHNTVEFIINYRQEVVCDAEKLPINTDGEEVDEAEASLLKPPVQPTFSISMLDKEKDPLLPVIPQKRLLKTFSCPIKEKKIKQEDLVVKQHEVLCKQTEYFDLKNQKLRMEIAILRSQMDKQELASSMCDLFGLEL
ncbi:unnamed protein product [Mytilus coruscus]|uniref:Myb/SANT-like DNA-binding domain-containing protein n=1 Tax=Mytilus coruscus TaxID=42192 RepID=A0A6J8CDJ7_MYTCO|nr:unnamed protein product [Mytilus coruscus]